MGLPPCLVAGLELGLVWLALGHVGSAPGIVLEAPQAYTDDGPPWVLLLFCDTALWKVTLWFRLGLRLCTLLGFGHCFDFAEQVHWSLRLQVVNAWRPSLISETALDLTS